MKKIRLLLQSMILPKIVMGCVGLLCFLVIQNVNGATINVSSVSALQTAINNAAAGDVIVLANGTYLNNTITIGTSDITVKAATPGGVFLNAPMQL